MNKYLKYTGLLLCCALLTASLNLFAQPANDECSGAMDISGAFMGTFGDYTINGPFTLTGGTPGVNDPPEPGEAQNNYTDGPFCPGETDTNLFGDAALDWEQSVWYTWTVPDLNGDGSPVAYSIWTSDGSYNDNCGLNLNDILGGAPWNCQRGDTQLAIYEGNTCPTSATDPCDHFAASEDLFVSASEPFVSGWLTLEFIPGETYYMAVDGWDAAEGEFCLTVVIGGVQCGDGVCSPVETYCDCVDCQTVCPYGNIAAVSYSQSQFGCEKLFFADNNFYLSDDLNGNIFFCPEFAVGYSNDNIYLGFGAPNLLDCTGQNNDVTVTLSNGSFIRVERNIDGDMLTNIEQNGDGTYTIPRGKILYIELTPADIAAGSLTITSNAPDGLGNICSETIAINYSDFPQAYNPYCDPSCYAGGIDEDLLTNGITACPNGSITLCTNGLEDLSLTCDNGNYGYYWRIYAQLYPPNWDIVTDWTELGPCGTVNVGDFFIDQYGNVPPIFQSGSVLPIEIYGTPLPLLIEGAALCVDANGDILESCIATNGPAFFTDVNGENRTVIPIIAGSCPSPIQCHIDDWTALKALYESTNGDNWTNSTGWDIYIDNQISLPANCYLGDLYGVTLDGTGRVGRLDLESNELSGGIPPELGNLSNLTGLLLYNNQLSGSIPVELGNISNLQSLGLNSNQLSGSIPPELGNLSFLNELILFDNQLSANIPTALGNLSLLEDLVLSENQLSGNIPSELGNLNNLLALDLHSNQLSGSIPPELGNLSNLTMMNLQNNYFTCPEIENFLNLSQGGTFIYDPQYYNYGPISINTVESIDDNTTFQLSAPFNSDDPGNLSFQWYQNNELIPDATDSILNIMVNEPSYAGSYNLQVTETCASGIDFFSDPVIVAVDGFDLRGEPLVKKQVIVQYADAQSKLEAEDSIFAYYNYELALVDSCNCNRELYLYEFEEAADQFDFVLQLNRKAIVLLDSADIDGGGFNYKIDLGIISNSGNSYKVSTNCEGTCEGTLEVVVLDTGYRGADSVFLREPAIPYCENALSEDYVDDGWHGTYGFNMITNDFTTGDKLKVMPLKIFDEEQATLFDLLCGIYHAIDNCSDVINISAGYYGAEPFEIFEDAIKEAKAKGIFIVTSAGNDSVDIDVKKQYPAYFAKKHNNVISVGSIDAQANYSSFSNYGNEAVTIAAYGEDILSKAEGALRQATGTSVATFIVSKELAHEIGLDKSRSLDAVWNDFEANRLIYKSDLSTKTITGKYLEVTIEQVFADDSICINLNPGWNLISFDVSPIDKSVANVFSDLQDSLDIVIGFDGGTVRYNPKGPPFLNTLKRLENGCGYWVKVQNADTLKVHGFSIEETFRKPLEVGWNLINFPQDSVQTPAAYFADLINNGNLEMVIGFDDGTVRYNPNGPPFLNTLHQLESGFGYWVKVTNSVNLKAK